MSHYYFNIHNSIYNKKYITFLYSGNIITLLRHLSFFTVTIYMHIICLLNFYDEIQPLMILTRFSFKNSFNYITFPQWFFFHKFNICQLYGKILYFFSFASYTNSFTKYKHSFSNLRSFPFWYINCDPNILIHRICMIFPNKIKFKFISPMDLMCIYFI